MKEVTSCQQQRAETWPLLGRKNYGKNWTGWWFLPSLHFLFKTLSTLLLFSQSWASSSQALYTVELPTQEFLSLCLRGVSWQVHTEKQRGRKETWFREDQRHKTAKQMPGVSIPISHRTN